MSTGDVLLFLGFCFHFAVVGLFLTAATAKVNAILKYALKFVVHLGCLVLFSLRYESEQGSWSFVLLY